MLARERYLAEAGDAPHKGRAAPASARQSAPASGNGTAKAAKMASCSPRLHYTASTARGGRRVLVDHSLPADLLALRPPHDVFGEPAEHERPALLQIWGP